MIDHVLLQNNLSGNMKISTEPGKGFHIEHDIEKLMKALKQAELLMDVAKIEVAKVWEIYAKQTHKIKLMSLGHYNGDVLTLETIVMIPFLYIKTIKAVLP